MIKKISHYLKSLLFLFSSIILSQESDKNLALDVQRTTDYKRSVAYGQDCDDTEYRNEWGTPNWKNYGQWLSECDSILTVNLDREFALKAKQKQRQKAIQDSMDMAQIESIDLDLDAMWENTVWEEIQDVTTVYAEVEQITAVAGVRGAEAEDEALQHLYYRRSMKGLSQLDLQKAYGKLQNKRDLLFKQDNKHPELSKINNYLKQIRDRII